ncbi:Ig-like domain-containing protein [Mumia zhuanghuii]|uniref:Tandem-95 repeat protein n=2 Tax=Mumia zhuanghuii TaxID=2585211 RepID=A0A5C4ML73_9ACTN|nr:Ig-like domain-containing protein [Mumia zhuanghuii]TNC46508.1 tandem-95 repeat protein [Mumia zhuanghuii]
MAATVTAVGAGAAAAADLNRDFVYTCNVVAAGLPLGDHQVGVNARVTVPDQVVPGEVIPTRKTQITLTLPETLRNATYGLLGARSASGYSNDSSISVTAEGVPDTFTYPIANLAADWSPVPPDATTPWQIPTEGDVPPITVPSTEDYPNLELPTDAVIHMPGTFNVIASLRNAAGELVGGEGAVTMRCSINGTDDVFGAIPIVAPDVNEPPTAGDVSAETAYGTPVDVTLQGADPDGDDLTYSYGQPANGTVSGSGANVTYTPNAGFSGTDSFTYTVSDGEDEATGTVTVTVGEQPNAAPVALDGTATTDEGTPVDITLSASDPDGDDLTYSYTQPENGTVTGDGPSVTYTPEDGFVGSDAFTFTVDDGNGGTDTATVAITVNEVDDNTPPTAGGVSVTTYEGDAVEITLDGADADGDELTYTYTQPANGTVTGDGPGVTYTPNDGFFGVDVFSYTVSDGTDSATGTVAVTVYEVVDPPNTPPTAGDVAATTDEGEAVEVELAGADADGDDLTYTYTQPANGTVTGDGATVTYTPADGFSGTDTFDYTVSDGQAEATGTVTVTVDEVVDPNTPPTAGDVSATTDEGEAVEVELAGADADGDDLTYSYEQPANGTVTGDGPTVTYTPADGFSGTDTFDYTVSDGQDEATGTVTVTVNEVVDPPTNTPPTAGDVSATTDQGKAVAIVLKGADADGDTLAYSYGTPANGTVTGTGANVTYTPNAGFSGTDTFTYTVNDGKGGTDTGTVTVTVKKVDQPPVDKCGPQPNPFREPIKWLKWLACKLLGHLKH